MLKPLKRMLRRKQEDHAGGKPGSEERPCLEEGCDGDGRTGAFAQADSHEFAHGGLVQTQLERPKLLVVGKEDIFTEPVIDYAISLAERLGFDIVAMNVNTVSGYSGGFIAPYKKRLHEEFDKRAIHAFGILKKKAETKGVCCKHVVKVSPMNRALQECCQEIDRIELVVTEPEGQVGPDGNATIPVFSIQS